MAWNSGSPDPPDARVSGMFSYTWSSLWGNYTGLTTTDQSDGGTTGRNSPDTTRSFDEPFYYFGANGKSTTGHCRPIVPMCLRATCITRCLGRT